MFITHSTYFAILFNYQDMKKMNTGLNIYLDQWCKGVSSRFAESGKNQSSRGNFLSKFQYQELLKNY